MSVKPFSVAVAGTLLVGAFALTACNDSTTASTPIGTAAVTTTSVDASDGNSSEASASQEASKEAEAGASKASTSPPETKPNSSTKVPGNFPGGRPLPSGTQLSDKEKDYLAELKRQNVEFAGGDDTIVLTAGHYVCNERARKTDPTILKAYVRAMIGPMTKSDAEVNSKSDKVISAADKHLC